MAFLGQYFLIQFDPNFLNRSNIYLYPYYLIILKNFFYQAKTEINNLNTTFNAGINKKDFGAFSFYSTKIITTGEGGMVTFSNKKYLKKIKSLREFGKVKKGIFTNYHTSLGYNWRMPEVSALMGIRQLLSIESFINDRKKISDDKLVFLKIISNTIKKGMDILGVEVPEKM